MFLCISLNFLYIAHPENYTSKYIILHAGSYNIKVITETLIFNCGKWKSVLAN